MKKFSDYSDLDTSFYYDNNRLNETFDWDEPINSKDQT